MLLLMMSDITDTDFFITDDVLDKSQSSGEQDFQQHQPRLIRST